MDVQQLRENLLNKNHLNPISTHVSIIDGRKSTSLKDFMEAMNQAFKFPKYYSGNMNSFLELMNDLSWLNANDYLLIIIHSSCLLSSESDKNNEQRNIHALMSKIAIEWEQVPNYEGEEQYRKKSRFIIEYV